MGTEVAATVIKALRKRAAGTAEEQPKRATQDQRADPEMMRMSIQTFGFVRQKPVAQATPGPAQVMMALAVAAAAGIHYLAEPFVPD
eukprot:2750124-Rhodomonas_salina.1